jgi:hypothetical protein
MSDESGLCRLLEQRGIEGIIGMIGITGVMGTIGIKPIGSGRKECNHVFLDPL